MNVLELRKEIGIYNKTLNNYLKTFNFFPLSKENIPEGSNGNDLRDYHLISKKLYDSILVKRKSIIEYEKDFYEWKTIEYISKKIGLKTLDVIDFFNQDKLSLTIINSKIKFKSREKNISEFIYGEWSGELYGSEFVYNKIPELYKLYEGKQLFKKDTELKYISSYQLHKEIVEFKY
ncbi:hypothetical protein [Tenacibaculum aestuarii]|uniref:hypothetical protein n=1 Tax=Tenacibaculum aestuarii TaxID=362781 RepID=UPI00389487B5